MNIGDVLLFIAIFLNGVWFGALITRRIGK